MVNPPERVVREKGQTPVATTAYQDVPLMKQLAPLETCTAVPVDPYWVLRPDTENEDVPVCSIEELSGILPL